MPKTKLLFDVDTGVVVTTASSNGGGRVAGRGEIDFRFEALPLRPRQYVLRLSITDRDHLASYDVVAAGPLPRPSGPWHVAHTVLNIWAASSVGVPGVATGAALGVGAAAT